MLKAYLNLKIEMIGLFNNLLTQNLSLVITEVSES